MNSYEELMVTARSAAARLSGARAVRAAKHEEYLNACAVVVDMEHEYELLTVDIEQAIWTDLR